MMLINIQEGVSIIIKGVLMIDRKGVLPLLPDPPFGDHISFGALEGVLMIDREGVLPAPRSPIWGSYIIWGICPNQSPIGCCCCPAGWSEVGRSWDE